MLCGAKRIEFGGVIYTESAEKAARFIMDCNQNLIPLVFFHDVNGFMVGRDAEWSGIIKAGAKMVNAVSNSVVPKITVIVGGSFGAGHYAMCGKAYDPRFVFAWPTARYAVMSGDSAAGTLVEIKIKQLSEMARFWSAEDKKRLFDSVRATYDEQTDPRYGAARLWIDKIIDPCRDSRRHHASPRSRRPESRHPALQRWGFCKLRVSTFTWIRSRKYRCTPLLLKDKLNFGIELRRLVKQIRGASFR